ncbi:carboxylesterase/lipase family protein [Pseudooceanicola sp. CBS1P-1]|uniref:Carboxylic ester hydrolase n=1 Tax=Pseudooceanicola albus TaxID=2692189 RepID=A0A6L7GCZ9_9RHOB|nr:MULTISPECIES: carboxylesterase/lipase family protein [Pseudooceanicola]MBT9386337.1 carboxylesterase/lipase family protein [Pseudooceanicola endophyticus]MXN21176.1 carboxylesterase family protein [Pseudooceanicola albus]
MRNGPIATTGYGKVCGVRDDSGVLAFKGIPYAASPTGEKRFKPPQRPENWSEVRDATGYGPTSPQSSGGDDALALLPNVVIPGDDFLNLNVWTESLSGRRPVMVFIHGGAFSSGSGAVPLYDGTNFARDGVVLVTLNYRLGADGFLWFGEGVANLGLLDQVAALAWVRDNIEGFGGDPENVTIFGESAGGMSVCTLMAMPAARGLFHKAIAQSGAGHTTITPSTAKRIGERLAQMLGVSASRDALADVPMEKLIAAQDRISAEVFAAPDPAVWGEVAETLMPFTPVIDGSVVPGHPIDCIAHGAANGIKVLIGTNSEEGNLFFVPSGMVAKVTTGMVDAMTEAYGLPMPLAREVYRSNRPDATPGELYSAIFTDWFYRIPAVRLAEAQPDTHLYEFSWRSPAFNGSLGACHASELSFVFDNIGDPGVRQINGETPPQALANEMHRAWVDFATSGDPGWPAYAPESRISMQFGEVSSAATGDRREEQALWQGIR